MSVFSTAMTVADWEKLRVDFRSMAEQAMAKKPEGVLERLICGASEQVEHFATEADTLREQVATLQRQLAITRSDLSLAWADCEDGSCRACPKCCDDRDSAIATLTAERDEWCLLANNEQHLRIDETRQFKEFLIRETLHLAAIETLRADGVDAIRDAYSRGLSDGHPMAPCSPSGTTDIVKDFLAATADYAKKADTLGGVPVVVDEPAGDSVLGDGYGLSRVCPKLGGGA